jgi:sec-independent protein translocase protein TatA
MGKVRVEMLQTVPLFGALPGGPEMLIILLVLVLLFGANKIPKLARSTGQAMGEFQRGREEIDEELQQMREGKSPEDVEDSDTTETTMESTDAETETETETETERNA